MNAEGMVILLETALPFCLAHLWGSCDEFRRSPQQPTKICVNRWSSQVGIHLQKTGPEELLYINDNRFYYEQPYLDNRHPNVERHNKVEYSAQLASQAQC